MNARQRTGRLGEELARKHLESKGYRITDTNHRCRSGEIDIIAELDQSLAFVEVRARRGPSMGSPEESITARKQAYMVAAAQEYLQAMDMEGRQWRIDVVAVELDKRDGLVRLDVIENAIEL